MSKPEWMCCEHHYVFPPWKSCPKCPLPASRPASSSPLTPAPVDWYSVLAQAAKDGKFINRMSIFYLDTFAKAIRATLTASDQKQGSDGSEAPPQVTNSDSQLGSEPPPAASQCRKCKKPSSVAVHGQYLCEDCDPFMNPPPRSAQEEGGWMNAVLVAAIVFFFACMAVSFVLFQPVKP